MDSTNPIVVFGGGGQVGRGVVAELLTAGVPVRATGRNPEKLALPEQVQVVGADLNDVGTLAAALTGARKAFLYAVPSGIAGFVKAAKAAELEHVVVLSSETVLETIAARQPIAEMHQRVEEALVDSGIAYTFLRPDNFATNVLLWGWAQSIRDEAVVRFPFPESHSDAIHERDISAVAAKVLIEPGHERQSYLITGPESVTQRRQAELIAEAIGKPIRVEELTVEQSREALRKIVPEWVIDATIGYWAATDGVPYPVSDTVEKITGQPARSFAQWAADHAGDFARQ